MPCPASDKFPFPGALHTTAAVFAKPQQSSLGNSLDTSAMGPWVHLSQVAIKPLLPAEVVFKLLGAGFGFILMGSRLLPAPSSASHRKCLFVAYGLISPAAMNPVCPG